MKERRLPLALRGLLLLLAALLSGGGALFGVCGPFTDVSDPNFCAFVLEIFTLGITTGTTPTTYAPGDPVSRLQMAAFLSRTVDSVLKRGSPRAMADRFWTPQNGSSIGVTTVGTSPVAVAADGADVWVANLIGDSVSRVRGSDGKLLETWTGAVMASGVLAALDGILVTGRTTPGRLYRITPSQPAGTVSTVVTDLGDISANGIVFDGSRIWTTNASSVSIVTPGPSVPWSVTTVTAGFTNPFGILYDGGSVWVSDSSANTLLKLNAAGVILQTVTVGTGPESPVFDGTNIWVPNSLVPSVSVVRASTGAILATLTGNGLSGPAAAAFDGQRVLIANAFGSSVSLWKAADMTPIGAFSMGTFTGPGAACSDGANFWVALLNNSSLARF